MDGSRLKSFTDKVDRLLNYCQKLESENAALREQQREWQSERARLVQKNELARNKIEAMIGRLKALEHN